MTNIIQQIDELRADIDGLKTRITSVAAESHINDMSVFKEMLEEAASIRKLLEGADIRNLKMDVHLDDRINEAQGTARSAMSKLMAIAIMVVRNEALTRAVANAVGIDIDSVQLDSDVNAVINEYTNLLVQYSDAVNETSAEEIADLVRTVHGTSANEETGDDGYVRAHGINLSDDPDENAFPANAGLHFMPMVLHGIKSMTDCAEIINSVVEHAMYSKDNGMISDDQMRVLIQFVSNDPDYDTVEGEKYLPFPGDIFGALSLAYHQGRRKEPIIVPVTSPVEVLEVLLAFYRLSLELSATTEPG